MKKVYVILIFLLVAVLLSAAELEVKSYVNRTTIGEKDALTYTIEISGSNADKIGTPELPEIDGFTNHGVSRSSSSSYTMVNGKFESSVSNKYNYTLRPKKTGKVTIPSITLKYKNKKYKTTPIAINIVPGSNEPAPSGARRNNRQSSNTSEKLSDNLFIEAEISDKTPYVNEPVELTYTIYTKYNVTSLSFKEEPSFTEFWKEEVYSASKMNLSSKVKNGERYYAMRLKTYALFPSQSGKVVIDPLIMEVGLRTESRSFWSFGDSKSYDIASDPITIDVKELPDNAPAGFTGAVGRFSLNSSISADNLKVGDSFTYTLEIQGKGNFNNVDIPQLPDINHLRFLDPEVKSEISSNKTTGSKKLLYLVIAQETGDFEIPSLKFTYFNPDKRQYKTVKTDTYSLHVAEGDRVFIAGSNSQSLVKLEGSDIGFIIENKELAGFKPWFESILYWIIIFATGLSFPIASLWVRKKAQLAGDMDYQRQRKAKAVLKKYLRLATEYHQSRQPEFYSAAANGLESYLTDKLKIARGSLQQDIFNSASSAKFPQDLIIQIEAFFKRCNEARFMPGGFSPENIDNDFQALNRIVDELTKIKIKGK